eukprot:CAMPEP_0119308512 /NCGR_PEP_ID=MMETSP1333-20130426/11508_1 /TAXON_ID=418940 /ORGANISM="Scyphosphaera apsteinii, Strain RCC1455" /LENGTH=258 /DNA_ID=CAMNT_0007312309 /DNA_START=119 /DNA_END=895 /DNA_ORIENTATION=+
MSGCVDSKIGLKRCRVAQCVAPVNISGKTVALAALRGGATISALTNGTSRIVAGLVAAVLLSAIPPLLKLFRILLLRQGENKAPEFGPYPTRWRKLHKRMLAATGLGIPDGAAAHHPSRAREEAVRKLITNHDEVLRDVCAVTSPTPRSQLDLSRLPGQVTEVDQTLLEVTRRLMGSSPESDEIEGFEPSTHQQAAVWLAACKFIDARVQATREECPGRAPDMSPAAAAAMRSVLNEISESASQTPEPSHVVETIVTS